MIIFEVSQRYTAVASGALVLGILTLLPVPALGCASCGCTLSSDAALGYSATSGWRLNIEYDYINQNELRSGSRKASPEQVVNNPADPALGGGEIEHTTQNRYTTVSVTYSPSSNWHFDLRVPYIQRDHSTFGQQSMPFTSAESAPDQLSSAHVAGLGDMKLIASYQGFLPTHNLGVQLGLKLPTGSYGSAVLFKEGPGAGEPMDNSLQAGTGSTDIILGSYYHTAISQDFDAFVTGQVQAAVTHSPTQWGNDFRPGNQGTVSFGLRYEDNPKVIPGLQVNVYRKAADQGALADTANTAGTVVYLSPGLTLRVSTRTHVYGFVQMPVYRNLDGYQLVPQWTASGGLSVSF